MPTHWATLARGSSTNLGDTLARLAAAAARAHRARAAVEAAVAAAFTHHDHTPGSLREDARRVHGRDPQPALAATAPAHTEVGS